MSKRNKNAIIDREHGSLILWIVTGIVVLFLFIAPFKKGLFNGYIYSFEQPLLAAILGSSVVLLLTGIYLFRTYKLETNRDLLTLLIWFIPLIYLFSIFNAASYHLALVDLYIRLMWVAFFIIGAYLARSKTGAKVIQFAILGSGYLLTTYGLLNWFGNASYPDALLDGNRLSNVFQYPNSYAAYLVALVMITLVILNTTKNKYIYAVAHLFLLPLILSFLLTLSRGAFIILPIIICIYFLFIPWTKQLITILYLGVSAIAALLLFKPMTAIRVELNQQFTVTTSLKGWMILVGAVLVVALLNSIINRYLGSRFEKKYEIENTFSLKNFMIPIVTVVISVLFVTILLSGSKIIELLPGQIQARVEGINQDNSSVFARDTFFNDAMKVIGDYPFFGAGGGAWSVLYESYKSYPYTSSQAHNFFMQYMVESGLVGILVLLIIVIYAMAVFVINVIHARRRKDWDETRIVFPLISLTVLGHSLLDFDMSFGYLAAIVFLGLGATVASDRLKLSWFEKIKGSLQFGWRIGYSSLLVLVSLILAVLTIQSLSADANYKKALKIARQTGDYNQIVVPLNAAIDKASSQPVYVFTKVDILRQLYQQTRDENFILEAIELLHKLKSNERYNRDIILREYGLYMDSGKVAEANKIVSNELQDHPWDIKFYEMLTESYYNLGIQAAKQNNEKLRDEYWESAVETFMNFSSKQAYLSTRSYNERYESRHFRATPTLGLVVAKINFELEKYSEASDVLKGVVSEEFDDPINREAIRWFLASLKKQGKWHEGYYNKLINKYPNEAEEIEKLVSSKSRS